MGFYLNGITFVISNVNCLLPPQNPYPHTMFATIPHTEERIYTHNDWFNDIIAQLREHQAKMNDKTMPKDIESMYNTFMVGTTNEIVHQSRKLSQSYFVAQILEKYVHLIQNNLPVQLAFAHNDNEILVWAELNDDDWQAEKALILAEAKINAEFHRFSYDITTTFVEACDMLPIPNHYQPFLVKNI